MIKIANRLESLAKYIRNDDHIMDVGCDHALLDIYLVSNGIVENMYVCDVNANALNNGIQNIKKYNLEKEITPILGYGIERIAELEVDTLIISGMGSKNIIEILSSPNINQIYKLVLQSNNNHYELRKFLMEKNFIIYKEEVVNDNNKNYVNIVALKNNQPVSYTEKELEFGPLLITDKENLEYFKELKETYEDLLFKNRSELTKTHVDYLTEIISSLESL